MSKKGLSFEEKKAKMLQLLHERREFFQLKELEKLAPKEKGITANSVKDVVQALVDDGVIDTDKIGGSVHFWSFPRYAALLCCE
jgi:Fe2+ or Zn2+ uptake regulation protein